MTDRNDAQFESLLRDHFATKLDGQLGRASERFMREVADAQPEQHAYLRLVDAPRPAPARREPHRRSTWSALAWSIGLAGGAVAAGIAVVLFVVPLATNNKTVVVDDRPGINTSRGTGVTPPVSPAGEFTPQNVEHALSWNTIDQGTVYLGGEVPLRSVVRQANETVRWYDPQRKAHVEMTVPRDEVMLVGYGSQ
jgi:hypothetical protein